MAKFKRSVSRVRVDEKIVSIHDAYENFLQSRYASCSEATIRIYNEKRKPIEEGFAKQGVNSMDEITLAAICQILIDYRQSHSDNGAWKLYTYIRTFLRWYWNENDLDRFPIDKVDPPVKHQEPKHGIT